MDILLLGASDGAVMMEEVEDQRDDSTCTFENHKGNPKVLLLYYNYIDNNRLACVCNKPVCLCSTTAFCTVLWMFVPQQ